MAEQKPPDEEVCTDCRHHEPKQEMTSCIQCEAPFHVACAGTSTDFVCLDCKPPRRLRHEESSSKRNRVEEPKVEEEIVLQPDQDSAKYEIMHQILCRCQKASFVNPFKSEIMFEDPEETLVDVLHWGLTEFAKISEGDLQWKDVPYKQQMLELLQNHIPSIHFMASVDPVNLLTERYFTGDDLCANVEELADVTCSSPRVIYHFPQETLSRTLFALMKMRVEVRDLREVEAFFGYP